jgi:hypothetical protein
MGRQCVALPNLMAIILCFHGSICPVTFPRAAVQRPYDDRTVLWLNGHAFAEPKPAACPTY